MRDMEQVKRGDELQVGDVFASGKTIKEVVPAVAYPQIGIRTDDGKWGYVRPDGQYTLADRSPAA